MHDEFGAPIADKSTQSSRAKNADAIVEPANVAAKQRTTFARNFRGEMEKLRAELAGDSLPKTQNDPIEALALDANNDPADKQENLDLPEIDQPKQPVVAAQTGRQAAPMPDLPEQHASPFAQNSAAVAQTLPQQIAGPQITPRDRRPINQPPASQFAQSALPERGQVAQSHLDQVDEPQYNLAAQTESDAAHNQLDGMQDQFENPNDQIDDPDLAAAGNPQQPRIRPIMRPQQVQQPQQRSISISSGAGIPRGLVQAADNDENGMIVSTQNVISRVEMRHRTQQFVYGVSHHDVLDHSILAAAPGRVNVSLSSGMQRPIGAREPSTVNHDADAAAQDETIETDEPAEPQAAPQLLNRNDDSAAAGDQMASIDPSESGNGLVGSTGAAPMPVDTVSTAAISSATMALSSATQALNSATTALGSATSTLDSATSKLGSASTSLSTASATTDDDETGDANTGDEVHIGTPAWVLIGGICLSCLVALYVRRRQPGRR